MEAAPDDERPIGTVPQAAEKHGSHQRRVAARLAVPVSAERDVEIIAKPARQSDVPAAPKIGEADRSIRKAEIVRHGKTEAQSHADRRGGVTGEVAENLAGERQRRDPAIK